MPFWIILAFSFAGRRELFCSVSFRQVFEYFIPRDLCTRLAPSRAAISYIFLIFLVGLDIFGLKHSMMELCVHTLENELGS